MEMTKEQWDEKQTASKKKVKYVPTGNPGEVKMVEEEEKKETMPDNEKLEEVKKGVDELSSLGFSGASEMYNQLKNFSSQLGQTAKESEAGKKPGEIIGGLTRGNLAPNLVYVANDIASKIKEKGLTNSAEVKNATDYLFSDPKVKDIMTNPNFQKMYPDFLTVVMKKAGIKQ
jgi:hypothetical protein